MTRPPRRTAPSPSSAIASGASTSPAPTTSSDASSPCSAVPFTIVGVMPPGFFGVDVGRMTDVMLPFAAEPLIRGQESRLAAVGSSWLEIMVRLKPGQSLEQANAALRGVQPQIRAATVSRCRGNKSRRAISPDPLTLADAATGTSSLRSRVRDAALRDGRGRGARAARRVHEHRQSAARARAGATPRAQRAPGAWRLALAARAAALHREPDRGDDRCGPRTGVRDVEQRAPRAAVEHVGEQRVAGPRARLARARFTAALACSSAIIAGVAPVLGLKSVAAGEALKDAGRGIAGDRRFAVRGTLVVAQIAVSLVLVVAAGLFLRTFASLNQLPLGFVPEPLLVAELNLQASGAPIEETRCARRASARRRGGRARRAVGIRLRVSLLTGGGWGSGNRSPSTMGRCPRRIRARPGSGATPRRPGWFDDDGDAAASGTGLRPTAIAWARRSSPSSTRRSCAGISLASSRSARPSALAVERREALRDRRRGRRYRLHDAARRHAGDDVRAAGAASSRDFWETVLLTINARSWPARGGGARRRCRAARGPIRPLRFIFRTFDQFVDATVTQERLIAMLSSFFGGLALLLAGVGLYGIVAHAVRARQAEIGLRMALGAQPAGIVRLVFRRVGVLIVVGLALGLAGSLWAARFVGPLLFQVEARDPVTFAGAAGGARCRGRAGRLAAGAACRTARSCDRAARRVGTASSGAPDRRTGFQYPSTDGSRLSPCFNGHWQPVFRWR